jgi:transcriptional regulator with XRE-family HTH domain
MDIGRAIKEIAYEKRMTQADLCRATGIGDSWMSQMFRSKITDPQVLRVYAICKALGVSIDDLVAIADKYGDAE